MSVVNEPDEGTLHEICWNVLLNNHDKPIGWIALEVATRTAEACLGHPAKPMRPVAGATFSEASHALPLLSDAKE